MKKQHLLLLSLSTAIDRVHACLHARQLPESLDMRKRADPGPPVKTAIQNVRVFNGDAFTDPQTVIIEDGFISSSNSNSNSDSDSDSDCQGTTTTTTPTFEVIIDGSDKFLIPGLIDAHVHVPDIAALEEITSYGVTTAMHMDCPVYEHCAAMRNQTGLASFFSAGMPAFGANAPQNPFMNPDAPLVYLDTDMAELVSWVIGNGSDWFKNVAQAPDGPTTEQQRAAVAAARENFGVLTVTHAADVESMEQAIASGTDILQHIANDGLLPSRAVAAMKDNGQAIAPTLNLFYLMYNDPVFTELFGIDLDSNRTSYAFTEKNVEILYRAGVPILAGTDAFWSPAPGINVPFGISLLNELELLFNASLSPADVLRAATSEVARMHRMGDRGSIEIGKRADLVLLNSNPLEAITNTRDVFKVWAGGVEVQKVAYRSD